MSDLWRKGAVGMNQPNSRVKGADEIFCPSCGEVIKREAILCVFCGVPTRQSPAESDKNKTTAILLSVFFAYWSWLYTVKKDWFIEAVGDYLGGQKETTTRKEDGIKPKAEGKI